MAILRLRGFWLRKDGPACRFIYGIALIRTERCYRKSCRRQRLSRRLGRDERVRDPVIEKRQKRDDRAAPQLTAPRRIAAEKWNLVQPYSRKITCFKSFSTGYCTPGWTLAGRSSGF